VSGAVFDWIGGGSGNGNGNTPFKAFVGDSTAQEMLGFEGMAPPGGLHGMMGSLGAYGGLGGTFYGGV